MIFRILLLPVLAGAIAGVFIAFQLKSRTVELGTSGVSVEQQGSYLGRARAAAPELQAATDGQLLRIGLGLCGAFGQVPEETVTPHPVGGLTARELYAITESATRHLCPNARPKVTPYLRGGR